MKYSTLKQQIEDLDGDNSLKEWDDVRKEIKGEHSIIIWEGKSLVGEIQIFDNAPFEIEISDIKALTSFRFSPKDSCQYLEALKKAYHYLLDHSDIPKVDKKKEREIEKLKEEIKTHKSHGEYLEKRIEELEA